MVREIHVQLSNRDADVIRIDAQCRMTAFCRLLQSFAVSAVQWDRLKQNHHHQVEPPHFVGLAKTVDASHLSLLVGIRKDADRRSSVGPLHALYEIVPAFLPNVLSQFCQQARRPFVANVNGLTL